MRAAPVVARDDPAVVRGEGVAAGTEDPAGQRGKIIAAGEILLRTSGLWRCSGAINGCSRISDEVAFLVGMFESLYMDVTL